SCLLRRVARQLEEHVVEGRLPYTERLDRQAGTVGPGNHFHDALRTVRDLQPERVGRLTGREGPERLEHTAGACGRGRVAEPDLDHRRAQARLELGRGALGDQLAVVDDCDLVREAIRLFEVLG